MTIQEELNESETHTVTKPKQVSYMGGIKEIGEGTIVKITVGTATKQFTVPQGKKIQKFSISFSGELIDA